MDACNSVKEVGRKKKNCTGSGVSHGLEGHDTGVLRDDRPIEVAEAVHVLGGVLEVPVREGGYIETAAAQGRYSRDQGSRRALQRGFDLNSS